jgi:hypothetical protein
VSAAALLALLTVPPLRTLFELTTPPPLGWLILGSATAGALVLGRAAYGVPRLPTPAHIRAQLAPSLAPVS